MRRQLLTPHSLGIASFTVVPAHRHTCESQSTFFHDYPNIGATIFFFLLDLRAIELGWENGSGSVVPTNSVMLTGRLSEWLALVLDPEHPPNEPGVGSNLWGLSLQVGKWCPARLASPRRNAFSSKGD